MDNNGTSSGEKASIILETLICYLREKNVLKRADIENLLDRVEDGQTFAGTCLCPREAAKAAAAKDMAAIEKYCSIRFGGKHRR